MVSIAAEISGHFTDSGQTMMYVKLIQKEVRTGMWTTVEILDRVK